MGLAGNALAFCREKDKKGGGQFKEINYSFFPYVFHSISFFLLQNVFENCFLADFVLIKRAKREIYHEAVVPMVRQNFQTWSCPGFSIRDKKEKNNAAEQTVRDSPEFRFKFVKNSLDT